MAKIWIHRKCARPESEDYAGDELILPKQVDETGVRICEVCREYKLTLGAVYLHKGDEVNWTAPVAVPTEEVQEVTENIPDPVEKVLLENQDVDVSGLTEDGVDVVLEAETVEEAGDGSDHDEVVYADSELHPEAEPEPSVTIAVDVDAEKAKATLDKLKAQIAKLQAKKDALAK